MRPKTSVRCPKVCRPRERAVRLLACLALCSPLGCATLSLHEGILQQPRLQTGGYPAVQDAREFGRVELGQTSYRFLLARDPRWTGKDVYRQMAVLIPDPTSDPASEGPVLLLARARYFSEQPFDRDKFAVCVGSDADAKAILAFWDGTRGQQQAQTVLLTVAKPETSSHSGTLPARGREPEAAPGGHPAVLWLDEDFRYAEYQDGNAPLVLRRVKDCLERPGKGTVERALLYSGYLIAVPLDILTSPFQILAAILFVATFEVPIM